LYGSDTSHIKRPRAPEIPVSEPPYTYADTVSHIDQSDSTKPKEQLGLGGWEIGVGDWTPEWSAGYRCTE